MWPKSWPTWIEILFGWLYEKNDSNEMKRKYYNIYYQYQYDQSPDAKINDHYNLFRENMIQFYINEINQ